MGHSIHILKILSECHFSRICRSMHLIEEHRFSIIQEILLLISYEIHHILPMISEKRMKNMKCLFHIRMDTTMLDCRISPLLKQIEPELFSLHHNHQVMMVPLLSDSQNEYDFLFIRPKHIRSPIFSQISATLP